MGGLLMNQIKCQTPTWKDMENYAKIASNKIKDSGFKPDVIIALARGGLVPARLFCDFLVMKKCYSIKVDHWGITAAKDGKAKLSQSLDVDITDLKVLVVDDITDTGESLKISVEYLKSLNPSAIKTATLMHLNNSKFTPDFYGSMENWAWIIFPWNYREDLVNLVGQAVEDVGKDQEKVQIKLRENCGIDVPIKDINETFDLIDYLK
jgi:uncharacterized protein